MAAFTVMIDRSRAINAFGTYQIQNNIKKVMCRYVWEFPRAKTVSGVVIYLIRNCLYFFVDSPIFLTERAQAIAEYLNLGTKQVNNQSMSAMPNRRDSSQLFSSSNCAPHGCIT
jgi:hypothetical protein